MTYDVTAYPHLHRPSGGGVNCSYISFAATAPMVGESIFALFQARTERLQGAERA